MKIVTIDASAAASWLFPSQRTPSADSFLRTVAIAQFVAPAIFAWEIGNQIGVRARGDPREAASLLAELEAFEIEIAPPMTDDAVFASVSQALRLSLTLFDTAYLNHALTLGAGLASRDGKLIEAAVRAGVEVFDLRS